MNSEMHLIEQLGEQLAPRATAPARLRHRVVNTVTDWPGQGSRRPRMAWRFVGLGAASAVAAAAAVVVVVATTSQPTPWSTTGPPGAAPGRPDVALAAPQVLLLAAQHAAATPELN